MTQPLLGWGLTPQALTSVTPFTYRDNATYIELLRETRDKTDELISVVNLNAGVESADMVAINNAFDALVLQWNAILPNLDPAAVSTLLDTLTASITAATNAANTASATATTATISANSATTAATAATNSLTDFQTAILASVANASNLTSGTVNNARLPAASQAAAVTNASNLTTGTVGDARLPTASQATSVTDASNLTVGTLADARLPVASRAATLAATYSPMNPNSITTKSRGAVTDGIADDTAAIVQAIAECPIGGEVVLSPGNLRITTPIQITKSITIRGYGPYTSRIFADNCGAFVVDAGVIDFKLEGIEIILAVRYSTTPNTLIGIQVNGTTTSRPYNHVYRDVYVAGFQTAFRSNYLWASVFDNFRCDYGLIGIDVYGQSMNNFVTGGSQICVLLVANSRGIRILGQESATNATAVANEGWTISDSFIFNAEVGVEIRGTTHCNVHDNIIDFSTKQGVLIWDNGTNFGGNCDIHDNYIAMTGAVGIAAIQIYNLIANTQRMVNRIHDNHCVAYAGAVCSAGVQVNGAQSQSSIRGNTLRNFTIDITMACSDNTVMGNSCFSTPGAGGNIYSDPYVNHIEGNDGVVYLSGGNPTVYSVDALGHKVWVGLQAHTTSAHVWGERVVNSRPTVGQPKGWLCTVAGTPGTWVSEGNL